MYLKFFMYALLSHTVLACQDFNDCTGDQVCCNIIIPVGEGSPVHETQCAEPCSDCCIGKCPFGAGATCSCDGGQTCTMQEEDKKIHEDDNIKTSAAICSTFNDCPGDQVCCFIVIAGDEGEPGKNTLCTEPCSDCCLNKCPSPSHFVTCSCDGGETCGSRQSEESKLVKQEFELK